MDYQARYNCTGDKKENLGIGIGLIQNVIWNETRRRRRRPWSFHCHSIAIGSFRVITERLTPNSERYRELARYDSGVGNNDIAFDCHQAWSRIMMYTQPTMRACKAQTKVDFTVESILAYCSLRACTSILINSNHSSPPCIVKQCSNIYFLLSLFK